MSLTKGTGPFGEHPAGTFSTDLDLPEDLLYVEPVPQRVRVVLGGTVLADSTEVRRLHARGRLPVYLFPVADVRSEELQPSDRRPHDPGLGERTCWTVQVGRRRAVDAAFAWQDPPPEASFVAGLVGFDWDAVDRVYEEDEEVFVHPRDPYHRIDVLQTSRRVRVSLHGTVLAESTRPRMLLETGLPVRWYLPEEDVRAELRTSATLTRCPYKGVAHYRSVRLEGEEEKDIAWSYPQPFHDADAVAGMLCFDDRVDLEVDGAAT